MILHNYKNEFLYLLNAVNERTGIRSDILEKDYYVTLILRELADKQQSVPAYFKGGTALYKAMGSIRRFSEDIDLTVEVKGCTNTQAKKRLENVSTRYTVLNRTQNKELESNHKGSITSVYDYIPVVSVDNADPLQRFKYVKIEATSFTVSEPFETSVISPVIYQKATEQERKILEDTFEVKPFEVQTIKMERIFTDKIFAAEFYYSRKMYFDTAKHIYDLAVMMTHPRIEKLLNDFDELNVMISLKRQEEHQRIGSDLYDKSFSDFAFFYGTQDNEFKAVFEKMQDIYVFDSNDKLAISDIISCLKSLNMVLLQQEQTMSMKNEETQEMGMTMV